MKHKWCPATISNSVINMTLHIKLLWIILSPSNPGPTTRILKQYRDLSLKITRFYFWPQFFGCVNSQESMTTPMRQKTRQLLIQDYAGVFILGILRRFDFDSEKSELSFSVPQILKRRLSEIDAQRRRQAAAVNAYKLVYSCRTGEASIHVLSVDYPFIYFCFVFGIRPFVLFVRLRFK